jgi:hypothetical protein
MCGGRPLGALVAFLRPPETQAEREVKPAGSPVMIS